MKKRIFTANPAKQQAFRSKWEAQHLRTDPMPKLGDFVKMLIMSGYEGEKVILLDKIYRVDYAHPTKRHVVQIDTKYHTTKVRAACDARQDRVFEASGWVVTRITYPEALQML